MRQTIRLGRVSGIPVGANAGVLVIVVLVVSSLAAVRFPAMDPGRGTVAYLVAALVAAVVLLASLLAHELGHALVARAKGLEVEAITLWMLGGVAQLRGAARTAGAEFAVAVVGPLVSLVLGALFGVMTTVTARVTDDVLVVSTLGYLAVLNVSLALFNMVPAAPLDGGRVLMAAIWRLTGDRLRASVTAARVGRGAGLGMIGVGVAVLLLRGSFGGLWLALIGWFLVHAATAEEEHSLMGGRLGGLRVGEVMTRDPFTARADLPVSRFVAEVVMRHRFSSYPLTDEQGRLAGLVTLNRLRALRGHEASARRLGDVACPAPEVPLAGEEELLIEVLPRLAGCADGRAVVLDAQHRIVGILSPSDISRALALADLRGAQPYPVRGADLTLGGPGVGHPGRGEPRSRGAVQP